MKDKEELCKGNCGAKERDFSFWMPLDIEKGKDNEMRVYGCASDENAEDLQGEKVFIDGLDISYLLERGAFNWNHGKEVGDILGEIDKAEKRNGKLFVGGFLYPHVQQAVDTFNLMRSMKDVGSKRKLGLSIEGKIKERLGKEVRKAWLSKVAMTYNPINKGSWVDILKSLEGRTFSKCNGDCNHCEFMEEEKTEKTLSQIPVGDVKTTDKEIARAGILAEVDAINLYEQMAAKAKNPNFKKVLLDIAKEEKTHVGEFQAILLRDDKEHGDELLAGATEVDKMSKGQKGDIDPRVEVLATEPSAKIMDTEQATPPKICPKCGRDYVGEEFCPCDPRDAGEEVREIFSANAVANMSTKRQGLVPANVVAKIPIEEILDADKAITRTDLEKQVDTGMIAGSAGGMAAGYDIPAATGGKGGSALREEDLDKKKKVTTYDERHLGLKKKDIKEMVKAQGYSDEVAERVADLIFKAAQVRVKPHMRAGHAVLGYSRMQEQPVLMAESPKDPYAAMEHEMMRISTMSEKALETRARKITKPDKLLDFYRAARAAGLSRLAEIIRGEGPRLGIAPVTFGALDPHPIRPTVGEAVRERFEERNLHEPSEIDEQHERRAVEFTISGIDKLATKKAKESFTSEYIKSTPLEKRKENGLGIGVSQWADWDGDSIMRVFKVALGNKRNIAEKMLKRNKFNAQATEQEVSFGYSIEEWAKNDLDKVVRVFAYALEEANFHDEAGDLFDLDAFKKPVKAPKEEFKGRSIEVEEPKLAYGKIPKELKGLWDVQYAPREKALLRMITPEAARKWEGKPYTQKMAIIDKLQEGGFFSEMEKAWPEDKTEGSLGNLLTHLHSKGQSKVKEHMRITRRGQLAHVGEHARINKEGKDGYIRLKDMIKKKRGRKILRENLYGEK